MPALSAAKAKVTHLVGCHAWLFKKNRCVPFVVPLFSTPFFYPREKSVPVEGTFGRL
jgi:hypothetical protein